MSKILANQIANYADNSPIELKEGLNIPAGKELQAGGTFGTLGQVLSSTGTTIQWSTPFSGNYQDLTNKPTIPAAQIQADWNATTGLAVIKNKPAIPGISTVTVASPSGGGNLSLNNANAEFTYTPPDLSNFITSLGAAAGVTTQKITNWDNAYGWGDHSGAGYLTSVPALALSGLSNVSSNAPSDGQVLKWNNANSEWEPGTDLTSSGGSGISLTDLSTSTGAASGGGSLSYNNGTGVFTFAPADLTSFITAEVDTLQSVITRGAVVNSGSPTFNVSVNFDADINVNQHLEMVDDKIIKMGTDDDLQISYTDSTDKSTITDTSTGLTISSPDIGLNSGATKFVKANATNTIIYHNDDPRITTTATGITVAGSVTASAGNSTNWNTAYGWGDHSAGGYLTSETSHADVVVDGDFTSTGLMKRGASSGAYSIITDNSSNWNTAYGWGNHASGGYMSDLVNDTSPQLGSALDLNNAGIMGTGNIDTNSIIRGTALIAGSSVGGIGEGWFISNTGQATARIDEVASVPQDALIIGNANDLDALSIDGSGNLTTVGAISVAADSGTTGTGSKISVGASGELEIFHTSNSSSGIRSTGGVFAIQNQMNTGNNNWDKALQLQAYGDIQLRHMGGSDAIYCTSGGAVNLYHNGSGPKFETTLSGVKVTGGIEDKDGQLGTAGQILSSTGTALDWIDPPSSLSSRQTYTATTISIADGAADTITVVGHKAYALLAIEPSAAAWVTVYTDATSRSADSGRSENTDPLPGSGVIAEVITTSANQKQIITPGTIGWNNDGTPSTNMYLKVVNKSGSNAAITVGMTVIKLEA